MNAKNDEIDRLPVAFQKYFWDCDFFSLSARKHRQFIIERLLNFGDDDALQWLFKHEKRATIINVVQNSRNISDKTRNFWKILLS
ncbi:hypothetical protein JXO59_07125 [candidate division KSB1 bacterium]|nr:hypothetical protein [candidate division KSB1 bacterium]